MNIEPGPLRCTACGRLFMHFDEFRCCIICGEFFCVQHVAVRKGVAHCFRCEERRGALEQRGVSDADEARVVSLLSRDLGNTVGPGHAHTVEEAAARIRLFSVDPADFEQRVVDDVQQQMHDCFIDTSWPRCPEHTRHPLWYVASSWVCPRSQEAVGPLGSLSYRPRKHGD